MATSTDESGQEKQLAADRPAMPASYGLKSLESGGLMSWGYVEKRLTESKSYWVSTTKPDGRPHAMPVWGLWLLGRFYFGTDPTSRKGRNLAANPAIIVHLESGDDVVIVEGVAENVGDELLRTQLRAAYQAKYDVDAAPDYGVRPQVILAWLEADFPGTATRFRFEI